MLIDIVVIAILLVSILISFFRGFIREILTILGMGGAFLAAFYLGPTLEPILFGMLSDPDAEETQKLFDIIPFDLLAKVLAYGGIFVVFMVLLTLLSHILSSGAEKIGLGSLDRTLGAIFGLIRGILLLGLLYLPFQYGMQDEEERDAFFAEAYTYPYLVWSSQAVEYFIPKNGDVDAAAASLKLKGQENIEKIIKDSQPLRATDEKAPAVEGEEGYKQDNRKDLDKLIEKFNEE